MDSILKAYPYPCKHVYIHKDLHTMLSSSTNVQGALHILCSAVSLCSNINYREANGTITIGQNFFTGVKIHEGLWLTWYAQKVGIFFGRKLNNAKF